LTHSPTEAARTRDPTFRYRPGPMGRMHRPLRTRRQGTRATARQHAE
jgi:hypothetical protein